MRASSSCCTAHNSSGLARTLSRHFIGSASFVLTFFCLPFQLLHVSARPSFVCPLDDEPDPNAQPRAFRRSHHRTETCHAGDRPVTGLGSIGCIMIVVQLWQLQEQQRAFSTRPKQRYPPTIQATCWPLRHLLTVPADICLRCLPPLAPARSFNHPRMPSFFLFSRPIA